MAPKVLISDALSPAAVAIFRNRGLEVDFQPNLGKDKDRLAEIIDGFDGLAIRSATKVTAKTGAGSITQVARDIIWALRFCGSIYGIFQKSSDVIA